jgi:hypothetical protein
MPVLLLGSALEVPGVRAGDTPALQEPAEILAARDEPSTASATRKIAPHEALATPARAREPEYIDKVPPPRIIERPGEAPPSPVARWIEGYWDWDKVRKDFDWVTGTWRVPPPGKFWVNGYWRRQEKGWSRVPGFWCERRAAPTEKRDEESPRDWRRTGPPPERPAETIHSAPGPDYFYIPGEYLPQEQGVVWRPGFWSRSQRGWEWLPARWVRQSTGWVFREGSWTQVPENPVPPPGSGAPVFGPLIVSTPAGAGTGPAAGVPSPTRTDSGPDGRAFPPPLTEEAIVANSGRRDPDQGATALTGLNAVTGETPSPSSPVQGNGNIDPATQRASGNAPGDPSRSGTAAASKPKLTQGVKPQATSYRYAPQPYYYSPGAALRSRFYGALYRFLPY